MLAKTLCQWWKSSVFEIFNLLSLPHFMVSVSTELSKLRSLSKTTLLWSYLSKFVLADNLAKPFLCATFWQYHLHLSSKDSTSCCLFRLDFVKFDYRIVKNDKNLTFFSCWLKNRQKLYDKRRVKPNPAIISLMDRFCSRWWHVFYSHVNYFFHFFDFVIRQFREKFSSAFR